MLGHPEAPANGSRGAGHSLPAGGGTTFLVYCSCGAALMEPGSRVSAGWRGFASAFLRTHVLMQLAHYCLFRKQEGRNITMKKERKEKGF